MSSKCLKLHSDYRKETPPQSTSTSLIISEMPFLLSMKYTKKLLLNFIPSTIQWLE